MAAVYDQVNLLDGTFELSPEEFYDVKVGKEHIVPSPALSPRRTSVKQVFDLALETLFEYQEKGLPRFQADKSISVSARLSVRGGIVSSLKARFDGSDWDGEEKNPDLSVHFEYKLVLKDGVLYLAYPQHGLCGLS